MINASIGTYLGSHDARDLASQLIEEDITAQAGRIMVCAAGNSGNQAPYHLGYKATSDTNFTWFKTQNNASPGNGLIGFEVYGDVGNMERLQFAVGADRIVGAYDHRGTTSFDSILNRLNVVYTDSMFSWSGNYLGTVKTYADSSQGTYRMQVIVESIDSVAYRYRFSVTGEGRFDLWSAEWLGYRDMVYNGLPTQSVFPDIAQYKLPDIKQSVVSAWACSDKVITVGNMTNRVSYVDVDGNTVVLAGQTMANIAVTSSYGPARTGSVKPEVTAPGDNTLTAGAFFHLDNLLASPSERSKVGIGGLHHRAGGTSSAAPVVAGIGALFLEKCAGATWSDFKEAITQHTFAPDLYTGSLPNDRWGYGKISAIAALASTTPRPSLIYENDEFCAGDSMPIALSDVYPSMLWNTGSSNASIVATTTDLYYAHVVDDKGCVGMSDSVAIFKRPNPSQPVILASEDLPACPNETLVLSLTEAYGAYAWSNGALTDVIEVSESGEYDVTVSNLHHCTAVSAPLQVDFHPAQVVPELHWKEDGNLYVIADSQSFSKVDWYRNGQVLSDSGWVLLNPEVGEYKVVLTDSNACVYGSNDIHILSLDQNEIGSEPTRVFPNPVQHQLFIQAGPQFTHWFLYDAIGKRVLDSNLAGAKVEVEVGELPQGVYLLHLTGAHAAEMIKVVR